MLFLSFRSAISIFLDTIGPDTWLLFQIDYGGAWSFCCLPVANRPQLLFDRFKLRGGWWLGRSLLLIGACGMMCAPYQENTARWIDLDGLIRDV